VTRAALLALALALLACGHKDEPEPAPASGSAASAVDPWAKPPAPPDPESPAGRRAFGQAICPKVIAPYLFRIEKDGKRSYLLGTRHLGVTLDRMPDVVTRALRGSHLAVFELAPDDKSRIAPRRKGGPSLAEAVGADAWTHYRALVGDDVAAKVEHADPLVALMTMEMRYEDPIGSLDRQLTELAVSSHVETRGLELASFQDRLLQELMDARALRAWIAATPDRATLRARTRHQVEVYCRGESLAFEIDDDDLLRAQGYTEAELRSFDDKLLFSRNRTWVPKLEAMFDQGDVFVAVGRGHLLGDEGLLAAFAKDGYRVTRVAADDHSL
jgi:uncharacterized protein YbaP (TraB family)